MNEKCDICEETKPMNDINNRYNHVLALSKAKSQELMDLNYSFIKTQYWICKDCLEDNVKVISKVSEMLKSKV